MVNNARAQTQHHDGGGGGGGEGGTIVRSTKALRDKSGNSLPQNVQNVGCQTSQQTRVAVISIM